MKVEELIQFMETERDECIYDGYTLAINYYDKAIEAIKVLQEIAEKAGTDNPYEYGGIYDDHWCAEQAQAFINSLGEK